MRRFKVLIVVAAFCLFGYAAILLLRAPSQEVATVYSQTQIQGNDLRAELTQPYFPQDPGLFQVDLSRIETLSEGQPLYRQEVTKQYGTFFSVSLIAFFVDPLCHDRIAVYLFLTPGDLNPTLEPISSIVTHDEPTQKDLLLFCRYKLSGTYHSSMQGAHLEKLTCGEGQIFHAGSVHFSVVDTILSHKNDFSSTQ